MKLPASYFSVSLPLVKENLRRYWAIPAISFLVYFFSGVFTLLISYSVGSRYWYVEDMLRNHNFFFMAAHLIVPIIVGAVVLRYIQKSASVTSLHAMPFTRAKLFNSSVLSGLLLILAPIILTGILLLLISTPVYRQGSSAAAEAAAVNIFARPRILYWMWESFIIILSLYAVTVFAGLVTGTSFMHTAMGIFFNFLIPALFGIFTVYCGMYLYGFSASDEWTSIALGISPYLQVFAEGGSFPPLLQILYILAAIFLLALSMFLYYKRKLERATEAFVFGVMATAISYLIAFFGMTLFGFYFQSVLGGDNFHYAGLLLGAVIFLLIGRMIVKKTFRVFNRRTFKSMGIYLLLAAVFVLSFTQDLTGFETRVPAPNRVNSFTIRGFQGFPSRSAYNDFRFNESPVLSSAENIASIREFHASIIENRENRAHYYRSWTWGEINYDLSGIVNMRRNYNNIDAGLIRSNRGLAQIFESEEYKSHFYFANADIARLVSIDVDIGGRPRDLVSQRGSMEELLARIDMDFRAHTYLDELGAQNGRIFASLSVRYEAPGGSGSSYAHVAVPMTYSNTIAWLRENGYD